MENNKLIIAAAGSGKTTFLVNEALRIKEGRILITTFTQANEEEIRKKFFKINKCIPENVIIQTWFAFLLQHGARPYQGCVFDKEIKGLVLVNGQSALRIAETKTAQHYFTPSQMIYSDKLAKFVVKCNEQSDGAVIDRLSRIYTHIFIDELQDLASHDLDFLKLIFDCRSRILLVCDPRQGTYSTSNASKHKKFKKSGIVDFFRDKSLNIEIDESTLMTNYRSVPAICDFSNKLYPDFQKTTSGNTKLNKHRGVFLINQKDVNDYLLKFNPMQLRYNVKTKINENFKVMTFGNSKGSEYERVLIYPTQPIIAWLKNNQADLKPESRSKFYVAITRAFFSVGIVFDYDDTIVIDGTEKFKFH